MQPIPVVSSLLAALVYDAEQQELHVTFKRGNARWIYGPGFTQDDADALAGAVSKGAHFLQNVKGAFPERRG